MFEVFLPLIVSFLLVLVLGPIIIPILRRLKMGNTEREYIKEHAAKNGTPSMGGVIFIIPLAIVGFYYAKMCPHIYPILYVTIAFAVLGFIDDFIKAVRKKSDGLLAWQKMLGQLIITLGFAYYMLFVTDVSLEMRIPFTAAYADMGVFAVVILFFAVLGTVNGANFTDGLDGLATSVTLAIVAFLGICSMKLGSDITPVCAALIGALLGFLMFNVHPAKVFMGDTGSLALGGFVVTAAYMMQIPIFIIIIAVIYFIEVLSVILQVGYFKLTHGKRIFRMAPIHHHFELGGWSEVKVVAVFTTVTILLCTFAYYLV